jgi:hypothetical protein
MATPFPTEEAAAEQHDIGPVWDPWKGPPKPSAFAGLAEDAFGLAGAGAGIAKAEGAIYGAAHAIYGKLAEIPVVGKIYEPVAKLGVIGEQDARDRVHAMTPNPATTGSATQLLHSVAEVGTLAASGAATGGGPIAAAALAGGAEGGGRYTELREAGVTPGAAGASAAATGVTTAAGVLMPAAYGSTLITRLLTGSGSNIALGAVSRLADHEILEHAGYHEMAEQEKVWDATQVLVDAALGAGFGGLHHALAQRMRVPETEDAAHTMNLALADRRAAPGVAVDPGAANAHQAALERALLDLTQDRHVDIADTGVDEATFARRPTELSDEHTQLIHDVIASSGLLEETAKLDQLEQALGRRERGEAEPQELPPPLEGAGKRPPLRQGEDTAEALYQEQVARETAAAHGETELTGKFRGELEGDHEGAKERYAALSDRSIADTQGGRILNVDMARELSPEYVEERNRSAEVHEPASEFIKKLYAEKLAEEPKTGQVAGVLFTAGGTGAGKTTAIESVPGLKAVADRSQIIYDTNMNKLSSAASKVEQALKAGKDVHIAYVYRDPEEALRQGALPRAMRMGRTVPVEEHAKTHAGSFDVIKKLQERYAGDPRVTFSIVDNSLGRGNARLSSMEQIGEKRYNVSAEELRNAVEEEFKAGRIDEAVRSGTLGGAAGNARPVAPGPGPVAGGQPQREPPTGTAAAGGGENLERVSTATGRHIEVRPRIVEAADLVTSDHPEYPQELQPRQRGGRKALENQVRDIAQNLDPERLGASAEADRGAPITGAGNIVESGNGRVMALRDVYANNPEKAQAYRDFLERQGYDIKGMKEPVLIRERVTPLEPSERRAFTVEANQAATAALSPLELAQADARLLDVETLSQMRGGDIASAQNAAFVRSFMGKVPESERNALQNPDGTLSQEGVRRIQSAILAKAFGGTPESNATLGRMLESTENDMRSTLGALLDAAPAFARLRVAIEEGKIGPQYDLSGSIIQAIENTAKLRSSGSSLHDFLNQSDFLTSRPPIVDSLMKALFDKNGERLAGREKVAERLTRYAGQAIRQRLDQGSLFAEQPANPEELLKGGEEPKESNVIKPANDMFGLRTPQAPEAAPALAIANKALDERPGMTIADETGAEVPADEALAAVDQTAANTEAKAPGLMDEVSDCALRHGT